jgi:hypothetical protein
MTTRILTGLVGKSGTVGPVGFKQRHQAAAEDEEDEEGEDSRVSSPHQGGTLALSGRDAGSGRRDQVTHAGTSVQRHAADVTARRRSC